MQVKSNFHRMNAGQTYSMIDPELIEKRRKCRELLQQFNAVSKLIDEAEYNRIFRLLLPFADSLSYVEQGFFCDYGINITLQGNVFVNANCVFLDAASIDIGDGTFIGPACQLYASTHPNDAESRRNQIGIAKPIRIGRDCWIGGGTIILPGVTIEDNVIVGAGSVVTTDVPSNSTVIGNPARTMRRRIDRLPEVLS